MDSEHESDSNYEEEPGDDNLSQEEVDPEAQDIKQKEIERIHTLKQSESTFINKLKQTEVKTKKKTKDRDQQMKDLINQAEKYASFLLSKHKMNNRGYVQFFLTL
jgi:hypothetical protein